MFEHLGEPEDLELYNSDAGYLETSEGDYWVLTYEEAYKLTVDNLTENLDDIWYEKLEGLKDIPLDLRKYIDKAKWAKDVVKTYPDEIMYNLASYDHEEHKVGDFYIYRAN